MKRGKQYIFDPDNLTFEEKKKFSFSFLFKLIFIIGLSISLSFWSFDFINSPELIFLEKKRDKIIAQFLAKNDSLMNYKNHLALIQQRDEEIYRPYLEKKSMPMSMRIAGTGGSEEDYDDVTFLGNGVVANILSEVNGLSNQLSIQEKSHHEILNALEDKKELQLSMPAIQPVSVNDLISISSHFGVRYHPIHGKFLMHDGTDFTGDIGTPIYATGKGKVVEVKHAVTGYGNEVMIDHGFGFKTRYAHLHEILVEEGQLVNRGDLIAKLGNTGNSTGPHLHYEVILNNKNVDPINYFYDNLSNLEYEKITKK
ncbi:MAG: peptidoglycan DD-metalloendopeptidase family protein [Bacteroidetes bacterium]|nr:peptidoglycan DD-metalloendopeptidase family protein [Bacteroidota bacterium]